MKKFLIIIIAILLLVGNLRAQSLENEFKNPTSYNAKPWVFWYWMYGAVSREGLKADLEAMKEIGLGGAYLMPIKKVPETPFITPAAAQLSPNWWSMVKYAMEKSDSLGLKLGMHICDGFALAGGPWITPDMSMQKVVTADTVVVGGLAYAVDLPQHESYDGFYKDIRVFAYRSQKTQTSFTKSPIITSNIVSPNVKLLADAGNKQVVKSDTDCWIEYDFQTPFTCRSIEVVVPAYSFQGNRLEVMASDNGKDYRSIAKLNPPRSGWQNYDHDHTYSIPATTARYFRFNWTPQGTEPGSEDLDAAKWKPQFSLCGLYLSSEPKVGNYQAKSAAVWRMAPVTTAAEITNDECVKLSEVIDITDSVVNGEFNAKILPLGQWKIVRIGHTSTGHTNETGGAGRGLECDKFNPDAVQLQFDSWFARIFSHVGDSLARRVLKVMHVDSWECGSQNWSANFAQEFFNRRGYDLTPYLLIYSGIPVESIAKTETVLHDIRQTVAELVSEVFYRVMAENAKKYDCEFSAECTAPTMVGDGMLHYKSVTLPMGEFWLNSPTHDKPNDMLDAISGAHIYGKNIVQAEGFTQLRTTWDEHPALLKTIADRNYALGINKMVYHVFVHNPWTDRSPGMTLDGIGLYFQRDQTWWSKAGAWIDYAKRCQTMLQRGVPVADVAVFTGEDIPRRSVLPDRLVNSLPGIFGQERVESERRRLANVGQPLRTIPVGVHHSAGMADPENWIDPLRGYAYDSFNVDVFLKSKAVDKRMVLESGASYAVVVMPLADRLTPNDFSSQAVLSKIEELRNAGVTILSKDHGLPYTAPTFKNLEKDFVAEENGSAAEQIAWTHRRDSDTEIYFVSNQLDKKRVVTISLRCTDRVPELWNPVTGEIVAPKEWNAEGGRIDVNLALDKNESRFVVLKPNSTAVAENISYNKVTALKNRWNMTFPKLNKTINISELFDLSEIEDPEIKYYSGTINYETVFSRPKTKGKTFLSFDDVAVMAEVFANDKSCGIVWTAPLRVDISDKLKRGNNSLRIEVVNTWANHIKGVHDGAVKSETTWTNAPYYIENAPLPKSGIVGNVSLIY